MSEHLYEITGQLKELEKLADGSDEMAIAVADTFEGIKDSFDNKALALITVTKNMDGGIEAMKTEIARLTKRMKIAENNRDGMREYLRANMEETGINKIECPLFTITLAKGRDMARIDDEEALSTDFIDIKTSRTPMKKEILAALKAGDKVSGASLIKSKTSLRIS